MGSITIRHFDDRLKRRLRLRAAAQGTSMEEEAREILRAVLCESPAAQERLGDAIRKRFRGLGDVVLAIPPREPLRTPPTFDE